MNQKRTNASAGRPTVDDQSLANHRKHIVDMLSCWWGEVGWQLPRATTRDELRAALEPFREHPEKYRINRLLLVSSETATAAQIREQRQARERVIAQMYEAQERQRVCADSVRQAQMALGQASGEQIEGVKAEVSKRQAKSERANTAYEDRCAMVRNLGYKLDEIEAGFAQDELLMFIDKRFINGGYARNPENLANAIAGLPFTPTVHFMGAWQSYVRCSKLHCPPHHRFQLFETVQSIWKKSEKSKLPTAEFFYREITALPKTSVTKAMDPITNEAFEKKAENSVRADLMNFWPIWNLAIKRSLESPVETDRMPFVICSNFTVIQRDPRTSVALVLAAQERTENEEIPSDVSH